MDIDWVQITRKEFHAIKVAHTLTYRPDLSWQDVDQSRDICQFDVTQVVCHDTVESYDEAYSYGNTNYYYKGLIR